MTVEQAAVYLNTKPDIMRKLIERGIVRARVGDGDISRSELDSFRSNPRRMASVKGIREELKLEAESEAVRQREAVKLRERKLGFLKTAIERADLSVAKELIGEIYEPAGDHNDE